MKLGLVGYGFAGRVFHAPFIQAAKGIDIGSVVARSADKVAQVATDLPGLSVFASLSAMIAVAAEKGVVLNVFQKHCRDTECAQAIANGTAGPVPARQSLRTVEVLVAVRVAAGSGRPIHLNPTIQHTDKPVDWSQL